MDHKNITIKEIIAKEVINASKLPKAPFAANPYIGCQHGCVYCYSEFMRKWSNHSKEKWGSFVDVKINSGQLAARPDHAGKDILFSSVTDPYQPIESKYKITRNMLESLLNLEPQPKISILTKSALVQRDIDLFKRFNKCTVGFSFSTLDDSIRRILEPFASSVRARMKAIEAVHDSGINTYVFVSPIMPFITDPISMIKSLRHWAGYFMFENLNLRPPYWESIRHALAQIDEHLIDEYLSIYATKESRHAFWIPVKNEIVSYCANEGIKPKMFFHHVGV